MNEYDIAMCEGENCPRREQCHRYLQLRRFRADTDENRCCLISMFKPTHTDKNCEMFWPEETDEQQTR